MKLFDCNSEHRCTAKVVDILDGCYAVDYANTKNTLCFGGGEGIVFIVGASDVDWEFLIFYNKLLIKIIIKYLIKIKT